MIDALNTVIFHLGADAVSYAELLGFVTGIVTVALTVKVSIHCFWTGVLNSAFFLVLFWNAHLWADASLQIVFITMGFWGWGEWLWGGKDHARLEVRRTPPIQMATLVALVPLATWLLWYILSRNNDIAPFWDALTTALSLVAQYLLNTKRIEQWMFWIIADLIYIPLYFYKALDLTGIVYVLFLMLAVSGGIVWLREWQEQRFEFAAKSLGLINA